MIPTDKNDSFPLISVVIPTWNRVHSADPDLMADMLKAVAADLREFA